MSFWKAVLYQSERFADAIMSVPINIEEWKRQQQICEEGDSQRTFELGFATFYMNRCNRSGIVKGAAPIGGYEQIGKWKMDARFYRETLTERVLAIGERSEQIHLSHMDAIDFLYTKLPDERGQTCTFTYLDPPYYSNGNRLYMNFYSDNDHQRLSQYMQAQDGHKWIMSYDDTEFIRNLYAQCEISTMSLNYSLQKKRKARELILSPHHVVRPASLTSKMQVSDVPSHA